MLYIKAHEAWGRHARRQPRFPAQPVNAGAVGGSGADTASISWPWGVPRGRSPRM